MRKRRIRLEASDRPRFQGNAFSRGIFRSSARSLRSVRVNIRLILTRNSVSLLRLSGCRAFFPTARPMITELKRGSGASDARRVSANFAGPKTAISGVSAAIKSRSVTSAVVTYKLQRSRLRLEARRGRNLRTLSSLGKRVTTCRRLPRADRRSQLGPAVRRKHKLLRESNVFFSPSDGDERRARASNTQWVDDDSDLSLTARYR